MHTLYAQYIVYTHHNIHCIILYQCCSASKDGTLRLWNILDFKLESVTYCSSGLPGTVGTGQVGGAGDNKNKSSSSSTAVAVATTTGLQVTPTLECRGCW